MAEVLWSDGANNMVGDLMIGFQFPERDEVLYRIWRLRRLIALATLFPLIVLAVAQVLAWPFTGAPPDGLMIAGLMIGLVISLHAVLFPNAAAETICISVALSVLILLSPLLQGSLALRAVAVVVAVLGISIGPGWLARWQLCSPKRRAVLTASTHTTANADDARDFLPLRPEQSRAGMVCGPEDGHGIFAVSAVGQAPGQPSHWAVITRDDPNHQETLILTLGKAGKLVLETTTSHEFEPLAVGCKITETDRPEQCRIGVLADLWLCDSQQDGLVFLRDALEGRSSRALRAQHQESLFSLLSTVFSEHAGLALRRD